VPSVLLQPWLQWADKADFNETLSQLAGLFVTNFKSYMEDAAQHVGADMAERILSGGPDLELDPSAMPAADAVVASTTCMCGAPTRTAPAVSPAPAGPAEHHHLHATPAGEPAGDSDVEEGGRFALNCAELLQEGLTAN
jgi:hypothetical protein